jgi:hypothetical protein
MLAAAFFTDSPSGKSNSESMSRITNAVLARRGLLELEEERDMSQHREHTSMWDNL